MMVMVLQDRPFGSGYCDHDWDSETVGQEDGQGNYMNLVDYPPSQLRGKTGWLVNVAANQETDRFVFAGQDWDRADCARRYLLRPWPFEIRVLSNGSRTSL